MSNGAADPAEFYGTLQSYRQRLSVLLDGARELFLRAMHSDSNVLTWYTTLAPMMFDMSVYPTRCPSVQEVRRAQGEFLLSLTSGMVGGDAERRSPDDWLRICTWQIYAQYPLMNRVFREVWSRTTQAEIEAREAQR